MPPVGFEPMISAGERPQTYALDRAATGTGNNSSNNNNNNNNNNYNYNDNKNNKYKHVVKSISELQIQVTTHVFELSAGNCHRQMTALSSFIVTRNDQYAHDCKDGVAATRWRRP